MNFFSFRDNIFLILETFLFFLYEFYQPYIKRIMEYEYK